MSDLEVQEICVELLEMLDSMFEILDNNGIDEDSEQFIDVLDQMNQLRSLLESD
jgi:hypothetical protein